MTNIPIDQADFLDIIEQFKLEIDKRTSFSKEEKIIILKSYSDNVLQRSTQSPAPQKNGLIETSVVRVRKESSSRTFAELVRLTKFKQHPDLILLATYYSIIMNHMESVSTIDIEQQYSSAMIKASTNTNANINVNRKKGYMMETEKKEGRMYFKITMSGVDYIESIIESIQQ